MLRRLPRERERLTGSLVNEVDLNREVLVADPVLAGRVEMELLQGKGLVADDSLPIEDHLDRRPQVLECHIFLDGYVCFHSACLHHLNGLVDIDRGLLGSRGTEFVLFAESMPINRTVEGSVTKIGHFDLLAA